MALFFTSDLHHEHNNIFRFSNRGLETSPESHTDWLVDKWNARVQPGDIVYHLGDLSFSKSLDSVISFISRLNGSIFLIKGNHDDDTRLNRLKKECGNIVWVGDYKEVKLHSKKKVILLHYPIAAWNRQGYGSYHLHGHCHGSFTYPGKILDVGIDNSYNIFGTHKLFSEQDIEEYMSNQTVFTPDHHYKQKEVVNETEI